MRTHKSMFHHSQQQSKCLPTEKKCKKKLNWVTKNAESKSVKYEKMIMDYHIHS